MAVQFYKLKVKKLVKETSDAITVYFDINDDLKNEFTYKPGQYLTLRFFIDGKDERRAYSICTSPFIDKDIAVTVKQIENGIVSNYANNKLKEGDEIDVMPPLGNFTHNLSAENQGNYIMFAGGSGITPIMSHIKSILENEPKSKIKLIYANRDMNSIIFNNHLSQLASKYDSLKIIHKLDDTEDRISNGRIDNLYCKEILKNDDLNNSYFFLCGPSGMMNQVEIAFDELNIDKSRIKKESFTVDLEQTNKKSEITTNKDIKSIKVILYGSETEIDIKPDETILIAGIRNGIDPPFSCQIGACSTCRAKLKSGKVEMEADDALMQDEIEEGYILTCTAHPLTDDVVVDYDDNF